MRFVRNRAEGRWLPSRHHFALFRLAAYLRLRAAKPEPQPGLMLAVTRDQSMGENYGFAIWFLLSNAAFLAPYLPLPLPLAFVVAVPLVALLLQFPCFLMGAVVMPLLTRNFLRNNQRMNMTVLLVISTTLAASHVRQLSFAGVVAWQFFGLIVLNAVAAVILFLLRDDIERLEQALSSAV
ncbi:MAG TPA: hypothetical protein VF618_23530 [Thermoanaerobaculia bacterium]